MKKDWDKHYNEVAKYFIKHIEKYVPDVSYFGKKVLDVGCWWGWFIKYARGKGAYVEGFDCANDRINDAKEFIGEEGLNIADAEKIPDAYKDKGYDVVFSWHVMEHVKNHNLMMQGIHRILKDNGDLILAVPKEYSFKILPYRPFRWLVNRKAAFLKKHKLYDFLKSISYSDVTHEREYTKKTVSNILKSNRFTILKINSFGFEFPYPVDQYLNSHQKFFLSWVLGSVVPSWWRAAFIIHAKKIKDKASSPPDLRTYAAKLCREAFESGKKGACRDSRSILSDSHRFLNEQIAAG